MSLHATLFAAFFWLPILRLSTVSNQPGGCRETFSCHCACKRLSKHFPIPNQTLSTKLPIISAGWSGYKRSASDELYHASWNEQVQGTTDIRLPFAATILEANSEVLEDPSRLLHPDTVTWILRARASKHELRRYF
ncbi:hypothetical protein DUNSADRAFT_9407 [Dunaliella salina]|uniref:Secreted protein n=1 Tax=Dunaliella salina TaxID=3046 RepID=A0ABQ7GHI3_DUNSA|nr:hypothetical protein DUNSADRAFT_9407 [Dunaliella salina]|eukprot:KAF5834057.1 hypothetical protein DUNSADRAFT_9407 [Dunaliella salina]